MVNNQVKKNSNLWDGKFREKELKLYPSLSEKDNILIAKYQKFLPILQDDNMERIDGRVLHKQMKVEKAFTTWIKNNLENIDAEENIDYIQKWIDDKGVSFKGSLENTSVTDLTGQGYKMQYLLTIECAKEIAMITGSTPRMNKETKEISKITRKYFIAIEKAFKERVEWNKDRQGSINEYYNLREVIFEDFYSKNVLSAFIPSWWNIEVKGTGKKNTYAYEMYLLDLVIIGTSAQEYRRINNLNKGIAIRNTFTEKQLEDFEMLQSKSAEYLSVNNLWNTEERMKMLRKFYEYYKGLSA